MKLVKEAIPLTEIEEMAGRKFGDLVKAVVDIERGLMAIDAELHADEEALLIAEGSQQQDLWGVNIYPGLPRAEWLEYDSMINLRPAQGNRSRQVESPEVRGKIAGIVGRLVKP